jgi:hypothetical protein
MSASPTYARGKKVSAYLAQQDVLDHLQDECRVLVTCVLRTVQGTDGGRAKSQRALRAMALAGKVPGAAHKSVPAPPHSVKR